MNNFKLKYFDEENKLFNTSWTSNFNKVLKETKNNNDLIEVIDKNTDEIIWSKPGGFLAQCIFVQKCNTTDEAARMRNFYEDNKNLLLLKIINKYR
ncbi:hypothetical protein [Arcobacter sp.]|jgi:hypothetical protein|uniref:hypothetical protein n=1 Tax=Arcobacter sp. TaxID=1872629 RepID=UPI003D0DF293